MHPGALGDFVDDFLVLAERKPDDAHLVRRAGLDRGTVGLVMAGPEHVLDIQREADVTVHRALVDIVRIRFASALRMMIG